MPSPEIVDSWAKLIENHGAMIVFAIVSGFINAYFILQLFRGHLVTLRQYEELLRQNKELRDDLDEVQNIMNEERKGYMTPLLGMISGLKKDEERSETP